MASCIVQQVLVRIIIMHPISCSFFMCIEGRCILKEVQRAFMECVDTRAIAKRHK